MKINRGEIWSVAWTGFAGKPRPALVIQAEEYHGKCYGKVSDEIMREINARLIKILGIG